jgi:hypothetical protein
VYKVASEQQSHLWVVIRRLSARPSYSETLFIFAAAGACFVRSILQQNPLNCVHLVGEMFAVKTLQTSGHLTQNM